MVVVVLMVLTVDVLLLLVTGQLLGSRVKIPRLVLGVLADGVFTVLSLHPQFAFLVHILWRQCALLLTSLIAYGVSLGKVLLFLLLQLSLGGVVGSRKDMSSVLLGAAGMAFACLLAQKKQTYVPVELTYHNQTVHILALRDTGNTLRDPITGKTVLVVGADIAHKLTGLEADALRNPLKTMETTPGLRLIPYQSVGNQGFLLAIPIPKAKIGQKEGSALVALSPNLLGTHYQALTGGTV